MLTGIHFLLTYSCPYECDHCFLHCSPNASGTFTLNQLRQVFEEIDKIESIETVFFEGGEPFLYFPLMLAGIQMAHKRGLNSGIVTNGYWANSEEDACLWLEHLTNLGVCQISISEDDYHGSDPENSPAQMIAQAAKHLGLPTGTICIDPPIITKNPSDADGEKGTPVVGGGVKFRGRAAEKLTDGLPRKNATELTTCPDEDLENPGRVHIDSFGHVHICQGLSMGNIWSTPLSELVANYNARSHPICSELIKGGPAQLAQKFNVATDSGYIEECHLCYETRKALIGQFPELLTPAQVYGLDDKASGC
ncbi:MAG: radical SAM protein [candidate division Zixibacteria bacterium]